MSATNFLENNFIAHLLRTSTWTKPSALYAGLLKMIPDDTGTSLQESNYTNYARVAFGPGDTFWSLPATVAAPSFNLQAITFPNSGAAGDTVNAWGLWDAASAGNLLLYTLLDSAPIVIDPTDDGPQFAIGDLNIVITAPGWTDYAWQRLVTHLLRSGTWTKPTGLVIPLYSTVPSAAGTGGVELSAPSYGPISVGPDDAVWSAPSGGNGQSSNINLLQYPLPAQNWGTATGWGLRDGSGNLYRRVSMDPRAINAGPVRAEFKAGEIAIGLD